jgi:hypothetical protein
MYSNYINFLSQLNKENIESISFKSNSEYNSILEHVNFDSALQYLRLIETEFSQISITNIIEYTELNDKYGNPNKQLFTTNLGSVYCSPTSLRYVYHALTILDNYKIYQLPIVEVGCGYGGLFLAINYFSKVLNIDIPKYYIIDLKEVTNLIRLYLDINSDHIHISYEIKLSDNYGADISDTELYFISNYCFTEISNEYRDNYIQQLLPKCIHGFITWQTVFGLSIDESNNIFKNKTNYILEKPQTCSNEYPNYFVTF